MNSFYWFQNVYFVLRLS